MQQKIPPTKTAVKVADAAIKHFDRIDLLANCARSRSSRKEW
jgi:hypothetical protein